MNHTKANDNFILDTDRLSHAYIVSGELAETLAMAAVCAGSGGKKPCMDCTHCYKAAHHIHPDITVVSKLPDKREIVVEQIRELKKDIIVVPNEADKKAYIINGADSMNINAQNAFLQILEEPPTHVVFILKTENPVALLPTVRSRCMDLKTRHGFEPAGTAAMEIANEFYSAIERGNAPLAKFMFRLEKLDKNAFAEFLTAAREQASLRLRAAAPREVIAQAERILVRAGEMLDLNVGTGHISAMICASLLSVDSC